MARKKKQQTIVKGVQAAAGAGSTKKTAAKSIPAGVKVIAVLSWIAAAFLILLALLLFVGAGFAKDILQFAQLQPGGEELSASGISAGILSGVFTFIGVLFLVFGVLCIFVWRGLWKGKAWARIVAIVLAVIGVLWNLYSIAASPVSSIVWLLVYGVIGSYLWFNKDVKTAFAR